MEQVQGVLHLVQQTNNNSDDVSSKACLKEDDLPSPTSGLLGNDSLVNNLHLIRGGEVYLGLKLEGCSVAGTFYLILHFLQGDLILDTLQVW